MKFIKKARTTKNIQSSFLVNIIVATSFLFIMTLSSCSSSTDDGFQKTDATVEVTKGKKSLQEGDYSAAEKYFKKVITAAKSNHVRATGYVGLAYSQFRLSESNINKASENFKQALSNENGNNDAKAGLSFIDFAKNPSDSTKIISAALSVVNEGADPKFKMSLDSKVDYNDLWLIIALTRFYNENYVASLDAVKHIDEQSLFAVETNSAKGQQDLADRIDLLISKHRQ